jgi:uncharacterized protein (DUF1330 family)
LTPTPIRIHRRRVRWEAGRLEAPWCSITQLVYVHPGKESVFDEFEALAIPLIAKHGGDLLLRVRPNPESVIAGSMDRPYEIHLVGFPSDEAFACFASDEQRKRFLHLKNDAVRSSLLVRGTAA